MNKLDHNFTSAPHNSSESLKRELDQLASDAGLVELRSFIEAVMPATIATIEQ